MSFMLCRRTAMAAILLAFASGGAGTTEPLRTLKPGILRIGTYFVNPPFEYVAHHARIGFEVDLMAEIAQRIGLKPTLCQYAMGGDRQGDAAWALRLHRGRNHYHTRARADTCLVGSLSYDDAQPCGERHNNAHDPQSCGRERCDCWRAATTDYDTAVANAETRRNR